jgi:hypothetical protein
MEPDSLQRNIFMQLNRKTIKKLYLVRGEQIFQ